jgi:hypothetical protein
MKNIISMCNTKIFAQNLKLKILFDLKEKTVFRSLQIKEKNYLK